MDKKEERLYRVVTFLKREELDFLDEVIKDLYFNYGIKVPRTKLIEEIIEAFKETAQEDKETIEKTLVRKSMDK